MRLLFSLTYNFALLLFGCAILPKVLYNRKGNRLFEKKMGNSFDSVKEKSTPRVWIHAVSMGETKAIWKFANLLHEKYPQLEFLITSATDTGHAEAKRSLPFAKHHFYLPFDLSWIIRPIVNRIKPDLVILSETDHWYNFLQSAKENGASIAVINGKLSERSMTRYQWLGPLLQPFFSPIDSFCVQNTLYQDRLINLGIDKEKIQVTGNLKFDAPAEVLTSQEIIDFKNKLHITQEDFVIVAGSTHEDEELLIFNTFKNLSKRHPQLKIIFVPRHPERFPLVEKILSQSNLGSFASSKASDATRSEKVILIDSMGQLKKCYQIANVAIVGGSFVAHVGGHNVLEPSFYGIPVVFGPFMHNQTELEELLLSNGAAIQTTRENLEQTLEELVQSKEKQAAISKAGIALTDTLQGTSIKTLQVLEKEFNLCETFRLRINHSIV